MTKRDERALIQDMLDFAQEAVGFCKGQTLSSFAADRMRHLAVVRLIQLIGEASVRLSDATRQTYPAVPWRELRAMRNILVHQYDGIDDEIVWKTATERLPELVAAFKNP